MTSLIARAMPAGLRNGLPERTGYTYRGTGTDTLTAWMDDPRQRPHCGRLMNGGQVCGRRKGHKDHHKTEEAMAADRATSTERSRRSRQRRAA